MDKISKDKNKKFNSKISRNNTKHSNNRGKWNWTNRNFRRNKKGTIVIAKPGDKIAVDGEIIEGKTHLDEAFITGESKPSTKSVGEKVIAGSLNYDGIIKYKAEKIGKDSTISEIVRLVIEASNTKAPIAKIADKISGYFVPAVILIAIITFIAYLLLGFNVSTALTTFVTILVVACPCSLGLATPLL